MTTKLIGNYRNGSYFVKMYSDGSKIRIAPDDEFIPAFAENCDVTITECCINGCPMCYANCTPQGKHADFSKYEYLIDSLHPYTELALNGNQITDIPGLEDFLRKLKDKKVFANMTIHQRDFEKNVEYLKKLVNEKLIWGIGVSLENLIEPFIEQIKLFPNLVLHVINGLFTEIQWNLLADQDIKILILGYKQLGRGIDYLNQSESMIIRNQKRLYDCLPNIINHFKVVSFDNLAIEQLDVKRLMTDEEWDEFFMGQESEFTFFINLVQGYFAGNSLSPNHYPIKQGMTVDDMFKIIRKTL